MLEQRFPEQRDQKALLEGLLSLYLEAQLLQMLCGTFPLKVLCLTTASE